MHHIMYSCQYQAVHVQFDAHVSGDINIIIL